MHRRPKKSRPSDINRNNVNDGKCITKVDNAPAEYTLMTEDDYMSTSGCSQVLGDWRQYRQWIEITAEDMDLQLSQSTGLFRRRSAEEASLVKSEPAKYKGCGTNGRSLLSGVHVAFLDLLVFDVAYKTVN